jgi:hypothetical protein
LKLAWNVFGVSLQLNFSYAIKLLLTLSEQWLDKNSFYFLDQSAIFIGDFWYAYFLFNLIILVIRVD